MEQVFQTYQELHGLDPGRGVYRQAKLNTTMSYNYIVETSDRSGILHLGFTTIMTVTVVLSTRCVQREVLKQGCMCRGSQDQSIMPRYF